MARRKRTREQVLKKLQQAEVPISEGRNVAEASRKIGVTEQTFCRWRAENGGREAITADSHIRSADIIVTLPELRLAGGVSKHKRSNSSHDISARVVKEN